jgi:hypothetical protein
MKHSKMMVAAALSGCLFYTGCGTTSENAMHNRTIGGISTNPININAHLQPVGPVQGQAEITAFQFLFYPFGTGEKQYGNIESPLLPPSKFFSLHSLNPFKAPVDRQSAINEAYYNAIENTSADYLVETRAKVETKGFSLFGIIGWGKAVATVSGQGLKLFRGMGPHSVHLRDLDK